MKKVDVNLIEGYTYQLETKTNYPEVEIIKEFGLDTSVKQKSDGKRYFTVKLDF